MVKTSSALSTPGAVHPTGGMGAPKKKPERRVLYFVDRKQQVRFAVMLCFHALLFPALFIIFTMVPPFSLLLVAENSTSVLWDLLRFSADHWWVVLLVLAFIGSFSIFFSHQIFGPVRRFATALLKKKEHPTEPVYCQVRSTDYFQEFSRLLEDILNRPSS